MAKRWFPSGNRPHGGLTGGILPFACRQHLPQNNLIDIRRIDTSTLQSSLDGHCTQFMSRNIGKGAIKGTHRGARCTGDDDGFRIGHSFLLKHVAQHKDQKPALASSPRRLHENREGVFPARTSIHMGIAIFNV